TGVFAPTQASADDTSVQLTISNTNGVAAGEYNITVTSNAASVTKNVPLTLIVKDNGFSNVVLQSPSDSEGNVSIRTQLNWEDNVL
ncbi:hypothetical protein, partial [Tenacibaculum halocynthiae]